ncbi:TetR/AcrR family transcriptional regulator [Streptomyces candidus]|uniref:DNA-binding transcriptional regulator YbjK n=1 Tax=Streptomyces candidus TaxID=67283 RepID=A0A7X0HJV4_9ACTN|nr:TetR/AcrR family transcriptional regulator [Streptomyces candidus]MBB6437498.1 DNA-binding transcriptional regulator YbjK [Streptomyces candidus]GHH54364.1 TetR family transcriptional regulator [Streptomyces candidus]
MARNPERRTALLDAAIEVLAAEGARGLTFRAVDARAGVPTGTASNYFADRDALLAQTAVRVHERMTPDITAITGLLTQEPSRAVVTGLMHDLVRRMVAERSGYLAMLELKLEATRRPALRESLSRTVRDDLDANVRFHLATGLPGDEDTVRVLYLGLTGLLIEHFTLPDVLTGTPEALDALVETVVERALPSG